MAGRVPESCGRLQGGAHFDLGLEGWAPRCQGAGGAGHFRRKGGGGSAGTGGHLAELVGVGDRGKRRG